MKYFSYDPTEGGYGFEIHNTAEKAKARAQSCIPDLLDENGCWREEVSEVCCGELKEIATQTNVINIKDGVGDDGEEYDAHLNYVCDYTLEPIKD